jgi:thiopeptide-type bacteriocin biosynthesis protein
MKKRVFYPGSEWLYLKIYTSFKNADKLLINNISCFIGRLLEKGVIDKWFFIRYSDPESHLRLRMRLRSPFNFTNIFSEFSKIFDHELNENSIWNIEIDTYKREIERYGDFRINEVESIFLIDSECILSLLKSIVNSQDMENIRWLFGFSIINNYLNAFSYNINDSVRLIRIISDSFIREFGFLGIEYTKQLNDKYREKRKIIEQSIYKNNSQLNIYYSIIEKHAINISIVISKMDLVDTDNLLISLIHMSMNRLFLSDNRSNELVLYYFALKFYVSEKAKQNNNYVG